MSDYYQAKKQLWTLTHNVKVYGHDVEPYVEEPGKDRRKSQGVFSLKSNKWFDSQGKFHLDNLYNNKKDRINFLKNK